MLQEAFLVFASSSVISKTVKCLALKQPIQTNSYASNSVLLSLAAHMTFKFPYLDLSEYPKKCPSIQPQPKQVNSYITTHPLQEFWCDKFSQAIIKNHAIRKENTLYIVVQLSDSQFSAVAKEKDKLTDFSMKYEENWIDRILKQLSGYNELPRKTTQIVYMNVSGSQLRTDPYAPIINVKALILGQIYNNENWKSYNILKGELPTLEDFLSFDAVIIPGSTNSVLSNIAQIQQMSKNLFKAFEQNQKLKIFGICYGHQLIAHKNKGYVVKKRRTDKLEKINFNENLVDELKGKFSFLQNIIKKKGDTILLEHHEDYVETVSDDFHVLASSASSKVQCLIHKSGRMLSFQSHPEYFFEYTHGYMQRLMSYNYNERPKNTVEKEEDPEMKLHHEASIRMRKVLSEFLNWNGVSEN